MSELLKIAVVVSVASFLAVSPSALHAQSECNARQILQPGNCIGDHLDALEIELAKQINDYCLRNGLPAIPLSPALSLVANRHVRDLAMNIGRLTHDWSNCAMTDSNCMWKAPQRLGTSYPGNGFENAYGGPKGSRASPAAILESWKELVECPLESLRDRYLRRLRRHVGWIEIRSDGWQLNSRVQCPPWAATHRPRDRIPVRTRTPLSHRTSTPCVYLYLYTSPHAANRPRDGRHQKRECDTNFFVCLLVRRYRIDALALPLVCFAPHRGSRTVVCHAQRTLC